MIEVVAPEKAGFSPSRLERVNALMRRYVEGGKLAGTISLIYRQGQVVHFECHGHRDREAGLPMQADTLLRIYSMTKPIVSVAALMLVEAGNLLLDDPIAKYIPAFADVQVYQGSRFNGLHLSAPDRAPTIQDLLRHTAGLSYGWYFDSPVEDVYRQRARQTPPSSLAEFAERVAELPLLYQPGTAWRYSFATDILGRVVEVASGQSLDQFLQEQIFTPLGMQDTGFQVPEDQADRFAVLYTNVENYAIGSDSATIPADAPLRVLQGAAQTQFLQAPAFLSGGGGLISTTGDYLRFCQMLLNGGVLDGTRLLGRKTVDLMRSNHLPSALMPINIGGSVSHGYGFGLGVNVLLDVAAAAVPGSRGSYGWGGAATTTFWIDPAEDLIALFMTQFMPSGFHPIQREFRVAVYQALVD